MTDDTHQISANIPWHSLSTVDTAQQLKSDVQNGLTAAEAQARLETYGKNELHTKPPPPLWRVVLDQFKDFVVLLLIGASLISLVLGEYIEATSILAIVIINAIFGVIQERRAEQALAALKKLAAPDARVLRAGSRVTVSSTELVPGDVVLLEAGNFIPADIRLLEAVNLQIEEAALTGESVAVSKHAEREYAPDTAMADRRNLAYMSTVASYGRGSGLVIATGMQTQIGLIAEKLQSVEEPETPLQRRLERLGKTLGIGALVVCGIVFGVGLAWHKDPLEVFIEAVSLAIAAVPEGLPAVVTISLALGMREMVKRNALIRKLSSVETLGSASVICSDKTGTLTQNAMTAVQLWQGDHFFNITGDGNTPTGQFIHAESEENHEKNRSLQALLLAGLLANDAVLEEKETVVRLVGDPTETALVLAAAKAGIRRDSAEQMLPRVAENPFESQRKLMSTIHRINLAENMPFAGAGTDYLVCVKGAPDVVLRHSQSYIDGAGEVHPIHAAIHGQIAAANSAMAHQALRVLGLAYRPLTSLPQTVQAAEIEQNLIFLGLIGIIDPPRPEVPAAIAKAKKAGIRSIMITGDYALTAKAIASQIGLLSPNGKVLSGSDLDKLSDDALTEAVKETDVFARVSPSHKVRLVQAVQRGGAIVAMTGDGVNDAPALKCADIGVAMGIAGTDVAKEAASMVLTDDNFASIVAAIEQGRVIYANIRKFIFFLLSSNVAEILIIFLATLVGFPAPLAAIQLLWLNLITDGLPALALGMEKGDPDIMNYPPRPKDESILDKRMRIGIAVQSTVQTAVTLTAFGLGLVWSLPNAPVNGDWWAAIRAVDWSHANVALAQTLAFVTLSACELFRAYTVRSERMSIIKIGLFSNRQMQPAVLTSFVLLMLVINIPMLQPIFKTTFLSPQAWLAVLGLSIIPACCEELTKLIYRRFDI